VEGLRDRELILRAFPRAAIKQYCYAATSDLPSIARQVVSNKPDVLLVFGSPLMVRVLKEAGPSSLPIVFVDVSDPVGNGLVAALDRPGGNVTGITSAGEELVAKRLELLQEAFPGIERIALLANPSSLGQRRFLDVAVDAAAKLKLRAPVYAVSAPDDLNRAFDSMKRDGMQAVMLLPDGWFFAHRQRVVDLAAAHRLPAMYTNTLYPRLGGLLTYGASIDAESELAAEYVTRILRGERPDELPVMRPTRFEYVVNARAARDLGIRFPAATMLRATQIIESP
jgi:putative ABC transport system substrate-binding protein